MSNVSETQLSVIARWCTAYRALCIPRLSHISDSNVKFTHLLHLWPGNVHPLRIDSRRWGSPPPPRRPLPQWCQRCPHERRRHQRPQRHSDCPHPGYGIRLWQGNRPPNGSHSARYPHRNCCRRGPYFRRTCSDSARDSGAWGSLKRG